MCMYGYSAFHMHAQVMYYYTPSAIELAKEDPSKWPKAKESFSKGGKTRRGKKAKEQGGKKRAGEDSQEEGEVSDTDSLASLNKRAKTWGVAGRSS